MLGNIDCISLKISIITIVRNGMPFVEQTIKSVLVQTYKNIEYIVIDGASTDGTQAMIESRINDGARIVYRSESDAGIADGFNKGLSLATGDYLLFLNADDIGAFAHRNEHNIGYAETSHQKRKSSDNPTGN